MDGDGLADCSAENEGEGDWVMDGADCSVETGDDWARGELRAGRDPVTMDCGVGGNWREGGCKNMVGEPCKLSSVEGDGGVVEATNPSQASCS